MFPMWYTKKFNVLSDFMLKGEVEKVGERDYRIPIQTTPGGFVGKYDPQLGDQGRGSSPQGITMLQSFFNLRINFELDNMQIKATENKGVAVKNPFLQCLANGMKELEFIFDKIIHNDGTAALGYATAHSSASGYSVYTMGYQTNGIQNFGTQLLRIGQKYCVYDSTLTTLKSAGLLVVTQISTQAKTVTLSGIVPNAAATDVFCLEGVSGANPQSVRGLRYWINQAQTGLTAGINRALQNQIVSKSVDGTNGLSTEVVMALYHRLLLDRGEVANGLIGVVHPAQQAYAYTQMEAIQMNLIDGSKAEVFDRQPALKGRKYFMWGGVPFYVDIHQDASTAHLILPSDFGKAELAAPGFFETPGKTGADARFFQLTGASGGPANGVWFGMTMDRDLYNFNPGEQGVIYSLPVGALYQ